MLNFLKNNLKDKSQSTAINNVVSEHEIVNVGIPQSSCLGPLFFLVYINVFFFSTKINMRLFAFGACLTYQHRNPEYLNEVINMELVKVDKWF